MQQSGNDDAGPTLRFGSLAKEPKTCWSLSGIDLPASRKCHVPENIRNLARVRMVHQDKHDRAQKASAVLMLVTIFCTGNMNF
jgi:hypothetical protein